MSERRAPGGKGGSDPVANARLETPSRRGRSVNSCEDRADHQGREVLTQRRRCGPAAGRVRPALRCHARQRQHRSRQDEAETERRGFLCVQRPERTGSHGESDAGSANPSRAAWQQAVGGLPGSGSWALEEGEGLGLTSASGGRLWDFAGQGVSRRIWPANRPRRSPGRPPVVRAEP